MIIYNKLKKLYGIIILLSVIIGMFYIYKQLKKENIKNKEIKYFFIIYLIFAIVCGKMYTSLIYGKEDFLKAGLSAYGGLIGVIIGAIYFEKISPSQNKIIKYTIISLPLVYSLTKIACFLSGCCSGIPYKGPLYVIYPKLENIKQFPIQIIETIIFFIIFIISHKLKNKKNITYISLSVTTTTKLLLDFLRYDHIKLKISPNQIFSIVLLITIIITYIIKNKKIRNKS